MRIPFRELTSLTCESHWGRTEVVIKTAKATALAGVPVGGQGRGAGWTLVAEDLGLLAAALYVMLVRPREPSSVSATAPLPVA